MAEIRRNVKNMFRNKCKRVFIAMEPASLSGDIGDILNY
jgi:hypothetical protein